MGRGTFVRRTFVRETICTGGDLYERHLFDEAFVRAVIYTKSIMYVVYLSVVHFVRYFINIIGRHYELKVNAGMQALLC